MKFVLATVGLLAITATSASAQYGYGGYQRGFHPYQERHHSLCQRKAMILRNYERRAASDGRIDRRERNEIGELQRDLARTCGGYRHHG
jgi:uncharacterized membrane protein YebE (DUF533 family)